jgi:paraquat-inducible protein B
MIRLLIAAVLLVSSGCQTAYYSVWETLGKEKRHLLKEEVQKATTEQEQATQQFKDVLTRMKEMYGFKGGDLEQFYNKLKADFEESEERAEAVRKRIDSVEQIASDLFKEWEKEISEISNPNLKAKSSASLRSTKERYVRLHKAMNKAEESMDPVLKKLKDYVLYLKHNLNAQAVGALKQEVGDIETEVKKLIGDVGKSIKEAEDFLSAFES